MGGYRSSPGRVRSERQDPTMKATLSSQELVHKWRQAALKASAAAQQPLTFAAAPAARTALPGNQNANARWRATTKIENYQA